MTTFAEGLIDMFEEASFHGGVTRVKGSTVFFNMKGEGNKASKYQLHVGPKRWSKNLIQVHLRKVSVFASIEFEQNLSDQEFQQKEVLRWIQTQLMLRTEVLAALASPSRELIKPVGKSSVGAKKVQKAIKDADTLTQLLANVAARDAALLEWLKNNA